MNKRAQVGMEYLMTYGWALLLIATIVGVIVFIMSPPTETIAFTSSDPERILVEGSGVSESTAGLVLQNATGGKMTIESITFTGNIGDSIAGYTLNGQAIDPYTDFPIEIEEGQQIKLENLKGANEGRNSSVIIQYTDSLNLDREVSISSGNPGSARGLVASYGFEEETAGQTPDSSGNKNHGSLNNGTVWQAGCKIGKCMLFDGTDDAIVVPDSPGLSPTGTEVTISAWIYCNGDQAVGNDSRIVHKNASYSLQVSPPCNPMMGVYHNGYTEVVSEESCNNFEWCFITGLYDGSNISVYKNGSFVAEAAKTGNLADSAFNLYIGIDEDGISFPFDGQIDEVRVWNRALTEAEITREYRQGS